jgi:hypothetical protein
MIGIVASAVRDTIANVDDEAREERTDERRRQNSFGAQQAGDQISQRHGAQGEFLALVDIVFDWDAICRNTIIVLERRGRERKPRIEDDDPGHHQQQPTRHQKGCEYLQAGRGAFDGAT